MPSNRQPNGQGGELNNGNRFHSRIDSGHSAGGVPSGQQNDEGPGRVGETERKTKKAVSMSMENMHLIRAISAYLECELEKLFRVPCPYCRNPKAMLLFPDENRFQCLVCDKQGRLQDLAVVAADRFKYKHKETISLMEERIGIDRVPGRWP